MAIFNISRLDFFSYWSELTKYIVKTKIFVNKLSVSTDSKIQFIGSMFKIDWIYALNSFKKTVLGILIYILPLRKSNVNVIYLYLKLVFCILHVFTNRIIRKCYNESLFYWPVE